MPPPTLETLRRKILQLERTRSCGDAGVISSGCGPLDDLLLEKGLRWGTVTEWLSAGQGTGSGTLALLAAREACRCGGTLMVLDSQREFYPPAAARLGIDLERLVVVHPTTTADEHWALDQSLRCRGVAAVLAWPAKLDGRTFRRLQLAAEEGGGLGLFIRPDAARNVPSWADVRLWIEPVPMLSSEKHQRRLRIWLLHCRGGSRGRSVDVEIDDETHSVHLAAPLVAPMPKGRADASPTNRKWGA